MNSDIKLDNGSLTLEGDQVNVAAPELAISGNVTISGSQISLPALNKPKPQSSGSIEGVKIGGRFDRLGGGFNIPIEVPEEDLVQLFNEVESPVDLIKEIKRLRRAVLSLNRRLKKLEARG